MVDGGLGFMAENFGPEERVGKRHGPQVSIPPAVASAAGAGACTSGNGGGVAQARARAQTTDLAALAA